jgi:hypothetical protein
MDWHGFYVVHQVKNAEHWEPFVANVKIPPLQSADDVVSVYVLRTDKVRLYVDDISVSFIKKEN